MLAGEYHNLETMGSIGSDGAVGRGTLRLVFSRHRLSVILAR